MFTIRFCHVQSAVPVRRALMRWSGVAALLFALFVTSALPVEAASSGRKSRDSVEDKQDGAKEFAPVTFAPRPPESALAPRTDDERDASVLVMSYSVEHQADISSWSFSGTTIERHRARYLVRDTNGVANLKEHTFFGDDANVIVGDVQGQTISPDGSVHPVDPDKDIRKLDIERAGEKDDVLRTVNFPRVEPGAILDLAWTAKQKQMPSVELVELEARFPIRELEVKVRGRLIGQAKSFMLGAGQHYWVPFFTSRVPDDVRVRMSSAFDLELVAKDLPSYTDEPNSPPGVRTAALLAIIPLSFDIGSWKDHFHLFKNARQLPDVGRGKREWFETTLSAEDALASVDELGLQVLPLVHSEQQLERLQGNFRYIDKAYKTFLRRKKTGESPEKLTEIAPPELPVDERIDRVMTYLSDTIELKKPKRRPTTLDALKKLGHSDGFGLMHYARYLLRQAGITATPVWIADRTAPLIVPPLETTSSYDGEFFLEVTGSDGRQRYLQPYRRFAPRYSLNANYLGSVLFRGKSSGKPWIADRVDIAARAETGMSMELTSELVVDEETQLNIDVTSVGTINAYLNFMYKAYTESASEGEAADSNKKKSKKKKGEQTQAKVKESDRPGSRVLRGILRGWLDDSVEPDLELTVPTPVGPLEQNLVWKQTLPWEPRVTDLGDSVLVPPVPMAKPFNNVFMEDVRKQPIWQSAGDWKLRMNWRVGEEFAAPDNIGASTVVLKGPGGSRFDLSQNWDATERVLSTSISLVTPPMLPASDYAEVRAFFVAVQQALEKPILLRRL